ncbi:asparaginase [Pusillimonas sp. CC-YST705]|uniref:Asparaginase n=1 Tax=Mesopusillimonas faecipullorum TaxID=2755040 RepID=A0ABS8CAE5_9BURK|nr:asparaginase [Mesopusillimonas faecipullorum]MCB5363007.1 asparaginase [Mesopusillimonas faecipullorum]
MNTPRRILVLYAGGTIGMVPSSRGYVPGAALPDYVAEQTAQYDDLRPHRWHVESMAPLLDSANAQAGDWYAQAQILWRWQDRIDGAVILHGTDTLAYAASFLSFLMQGFGRPVVITASQLPLGVQYSDAPANLLAALRCALLSDLHEVALCFGGQLLRGNRVVKLGPSPDEGFASPHWPVLGDTRRHATLHGQYLLPKQAISAAPKLNGISASVGLLRLYPGIPASVVQAVGQAHPQGLVLEMYGIGAGPSINRQLCTALGQLHHAGTPVVAVSQCPYAAVKDLGVYESGQAFAQQGVIAGLDLTPAAAFAKLHYLSTQGLLAESAQWQASIQTPLVGEVTP